MITNHTFAKLLHFAEVPGHTEITQALMKRMQTNGNIVFACSLTPKKNLNPYKPIWKQLEPTVCVGFRTPKKYPKLIEP